MKQADRATAPLQNIALNRNRLRDKLLRHNAMDAFEATWQQFTATGRYLIEADGGWIMGTWL